MVSFLTAPKQLLCYLKAVSGAEVERDEGKPDDAGGVHGETDELALVEVLRNLPRLDGVQCASSDEHHVEGEREEEAAVTDATLQYHLGTFPIGVVLSNARHFQQKPNQGAQSLKCKKC